MVFAYVVAVDVNGPKLQNPPWSTHVLLGHEL